MNNAEGPREPYLFALTLGLLVIWAGLLFGGYVLGKRTETNHQRIPRAARMLSSLALVLAAWAFAFFSDEEGMGFRGFVAFGMTFGFLGDLFMAGVIGKRNVIGGMLAFGTGHMLYIAGFSVLATIPALAERGAALVFWPVLLAWMIALACWYGVVLRPASQRTTLHWLALPYSILLATTLGVAVGAALMLGQGQAWLPVIGAALFLLSDLILAAEMFNGLTFKRVAIGDVVWLTYGPAQMLIVYGAAVIGTSV
ncbi:MAG: lysoplasmalogenase [Anaerolineae bacterium]|nr:lysoplasmalogenase [Anaerolineae bacterium]